jgi:hypothetical protein
MLKFPGGDTPIPGIYDIICFRGLSSLSSLYTYQQDKS